MGNHIVNSERRAGSDQPDWRRARRRGRRWPALALVLVLALLATACGDDDSDGTTGGQTDETTEAADKEPYRIGYIGPLSGNLATIGTSQLTALTAAAEARNAEGGVNGHMIEILAEDDATDPAKGIAAARKLISDGVLVIVGPPVSSINEAVLPTTERADVSIVTPGATPANLDPAKRNMFQVDQTSASQAQPMVDFATELLGKEDFRVSIAPIDTPSGLAWGENVAELEGMRDFELLSSTPLPVAAGDITPQAQSVVEGDPEIVLAEATDVPFVTFVQKLRDLGYDGPIVNFQGGSSKAVFEQLQDEDVYGARTYTHYDESATDPGVQTYVKSVQAQDAVQLATSASLFGSVYVAGLAVLGAIEECGDECTPTAVTDALNALDVDTEGLTPENLTFSEDDHQTMTTDVFWHWDGSKPAPALEGQTFCGSVYSLEEEC
jgi:branched-chain amino acid transport system substrate-binding protein